jgi:hypothetical protein
MCARCERRFNHLGVIAESSQNCTPREKTVGSQWIESKAKGAAKNFSLWPPENRALEPLQNQGFQQAVPGGVFGQGGS